MFSIDLVCNKRAIDLVDKLIKKMADTDTLTNITGFVEFSTKKYEDFYSTMKQFIIDHKHQIKDSMVRRMLDRLGKDPEDLTRIDIDNIPHFMFPFFGPCANISAKVLIILCNDPNRTCDDLANDSKLLINYIHETLRLYPEVMSQIRQVNENRMWKGKQLRKGDVIFITNHLTQRNGLVLPEPHTFNPNHVSDPLYQNILNGFSQGTRVCPGKNLSLFCLILFFKHIFKTRRYRTNNRFCLRRVPDELDMINTSYTPYLKTQ